MQTVLITEPQQDNTTTPKQHQSNTKTEPQSEPQQDRASHSKTERGQSSHDTDVTRTRLLIDCTFFIQFISPFAQKFKNSYERDTFYNLNRDTDSPHPFNAGTLKQ